ncbi:MAG TPA: hypothetical protein VMZ28_25465 [Kofleriaceae bacterium]|nr:hypothetical protein [Kofleriaceae bacterium]
MTNRTGSAPSRAAIRAALAARRAHHLEVLHAYRTTGIFPHNSTQPGEGHFLIDPRGVLCAVANLIAQDGHRDLIDDASRTDNGLLFASVERGPFHDWILSSGFTREEIGRIQVPAPYVGPMPEELIPVQPGPEPAPAPRPIAVDPFAAADMQVAAYLDAIESTLRASTDAALDLAVAALAERPDLAVAIVRDPAPAPDAVATIRFAQPPQ